MTNGLDTTRVTPRPPLRVRLKRYLPIAVIALGAVASLLFLRNYLSFEALETHYTALLAWRDSNIVLAAAVFAGIYTLTVAFSVPGAVWLTLIAGLLFGVTLGSALVVLSATLGATLVFLAARSALGDGLRARAGGWVRRLETGFREGQVSFLLMMRLVPAVPFWIANLAPAVLGAELRTFVWTTLVGILPATVIYTWVGAGLGAEIAAGQRPDLGVIFEPHILGPLLGLAALAALPVVLKRAGIRRPG